LVPPPFLLSAQGSVPTADLLGEEVRVEGYRSLFGPLLLLLLLLSSGGVATGHVEELELGGVV
jgi:hypothetical protein